MLITAGFGATFVGMQAFEWTKLIVEEGVRPWGNPHGRRAVRLGVLHDHRLPRPARVGRRDLPDCRGAARSGAATTSARATTRSSRSPACTGTSSTWSGSSSSRSSISGRGQHGAQHRQARRPAASDQHLPVDLGAAVRAEHLLLPGRLLPPAGHAALDADHPVHAAEGGLHRRHLHAHGVGAPGAEARHPGAAAVPAGADRPDGDRRRLHVPDALVALRRPDAGWRAGAFPFTPRRGSDTMRTSPAAESARARHTRPDRPRPEGHRHLLAGRQGRQHGLPLGPDPARSGDRRAGERRHGSAGPPRVRQPARRRDGRRRRPRRRRQAERVPDRPRRTSRWSTR